MEDGMKVIKTMWNKYGRKKWGVKELNKVITNALLKGLEFAKEKKGVLRFATLGSFTPESLSEVSVKRILGLAESEEEVNL